MGEERGREEQRGPEREEGKGKGSERKRRKGKGALRQHPVLPHALLPLPGQLSLELHVGAAREAQDFPVS